MSEDPIVEEVRRARQEHSAQFDHDLAAICRDLREKEAQGGRTVVVLEPRRPASSDRR